MTTEPEVMGTPTYFGELCTKLFSDLKDDATIIEVGTWMGASAFKMVQACEKNVRCIVLIHGLVI
jgi:predicted O-methyltransferase YrrM